MIQCDERWWIGQALMLRITNVIIIFALTLIFAKTWCEMVSFLSLKRIYRKIMDVYNNEKFPREQHSR